MLLVALLNQPALASGAEIGGYFRVMTRPDFQGGDGKLGYWNLYGRLLNEGPYATVEMKLPILEQRPASSEVWTSVHMKVEGGSVGNADSGNGNLSNFRMSQLYAEAGNVLLDRVTWRVGSLETYFGDLGLYDMRPTTLFQDTVGLSARYRDERAELLLGFGDAGYALRGSEYMTVFSPGASARFQLGRHVQLGLGGQLYHEPEVTGNRYAPHSTPGLDYEDVLRGEVVQSFLEDNPGEAIAFPDPEPTSNTSYKAVATFGFGGFGPLVWNSVQASYQLVHPDNFVDETYEGETYTLYVTELTDERSVLVVGDEVQLQLIPGRLDMALAGLWGLHQDGDNAIAPSSDARSYASAVARIQTYLSPTVHLLIESSLAREISTNGNTYRNHQDSIFENDAGASDPRGLEYGDSDTRDTWQGKAGFVLNPLGPGIYTRPSLRLLYGLQHSTQNNAFGNSFVEDLDQYNEFGNVERHWHHVLALETEVWF